MARPATLKRDPAIRRFLRVSLPRIVRRYSPREVWLFGSRVRGDAMEYSDLDLIIVADSFHGIDWVDRAGPVLVSCDVGNTDVLCYTPEEFARKRRELGIVQAAVEEGACVYRAPRGAVPPTRSPRRPRRGAARSAGRPRRGRAAGRSGGA